MSILANLRILRGQTKKIHSQAREMARRVRQMQKVMANNDYYLRAIARDERKVSPEEYAIDRMHTSSKFKLRDVVMWIGSTVEAESLIARLKRTGQIFYDRASASWIMSNDGFGLPA
jgi:hypothetical protein